MRFLHTTTDEFFDHTGIVFDESVNPVSVLPKADQFRSGAKRN
jgi:hypothetical protein